MRRVVKGVLLGAAVGGTVVVVKALRSNEPTDNMAKQAATVTGAAAAVGALGGLILDRRAQRKAKKRRTLSPGSLAEVALSAGPAIGKTTRRTRKAAAKAAKKAAKHASKTAKKVQPVGKAAGKAAGKAREQAAHLAEVAAPRFEQAAEAARQKLAS